MDATEKRRIRAKIMDEVIRFGAGGAFITAALFAQGMAKAASKRFDTLMGKLDVRERDRELKQLMYRMKERGLLDGDYEHGLQITDKARRRLERADIGELHMQRADTWDGIWRVVVYDIPEERKIARQALQSKLLGYGCVMLQKSIWITPFPCRVDIETICAHYAVDDRVTYFEASAIDNAEALLARFRKRYPSTAFPIPKKTSIE